MGVTRYVAFPQTTTVRVGLVGSLVVNVIVAPSGPAAVGSTVTVKLWLPPPVTVVAVFGLTETRALVGVTLGAPRFRVCEPLLTIVIIAVWVTAPAEATLAGDR